MTAEPELIWKGGLKELERLPRLWAGDEIDCSRCGGQHIVFSGRDPESGVEVNALFFRCGDELRIAAVDGRDVTNAAPQSTSTSS